MPYLFLLALLVSFQSCNTTDEYDDPMTYRNIRNAVDDSFDRMVDNAKQGERVIGTVYFPFDRAELTAPEIEKLSQIAGDLKRYAGPIVVEGHTDYHNTEQYNQRLGYNRAYYVADYLKSAGIWDQRLYVKSFGESRPVASNWDAEGQGRNRRVDIKVAASAGEGMAGKESIKAYAGMFEKKETSSSKYKGSGINLFVENSK